MRLSEKVLGGRLLIITLEQGTDHIHTHLLKASQGGRGNNSQIAFPQDNSSLGRYLFS